MLKKNDKKINKKIIYFVLFVIMLAVIILFYNSGYNYNFKYKSSDEIKIIVMNNLNKIQDNFTLNVTKDDLEEEYGLEYMSDSNMRMYSGNALPVTGYLIYNDSYYKLENEKLEKVKSISINKIIDEKYYNISLIKKLINRCNLENVSLIRTKCTLSLKEYFEEYNNYFGKEITVDTDDNINFEILYDNTRVRNIKIDYTNVSKILDGKDNKIIYSIDIDDVNKNDFSEYVNYIEKNN